jgi:hypothetical protein
VVQWRDGFNGPYPPLDYSGESFPYPFGQKKVHAWERLRVEAGLEMATLEATHDGWQQDLATTPSVTACPSLTGKTDSTINRGPNQGSGTWTCGDRGGFCVNDVNVSNTTPHYKYSTYGLNSGLVGRGIFAWGERWNIPDNYGVRLSAIRNRVVLAMDGAGFGRDGLYWDKNKNADPCFLGFSPHGSRDVTNVLWTDMSASSFPARIDTYTPFPSRGETQVYWVHGFTREEWGMLPGWPPKTYWDLLE